MHHKTLSSAFGAHGNELLGTRWVDADCSVKLSFTCTTLKSNGQALYDLGRIRTYHVTSEHQIGLAIDNKLHHNLVCSPLRDRVFERREPGYIDVHTVCAEFLVGLSLGQSD